GLGGMDRLLGAGLGLVRGLILGVALVAVLTAYPFWPRLLTGSRLAPACMWGSRALVLVMPAGLEQDFSNGMARIGKGLP
ncbi:MAG: CvpA family protein, partial [Terriglobales bacterium]